MYKVIYQWPKKGGEKGSKSFDSAVEAIEFMTDGGKDRTDFITSKSTISLYDSQNGNFELISYGQLVRDCMVELRNYISTENEIEETIEGFEGG